MTRFWTSVAALACAATFVLAANAASPDRKPPRIVAAAMRDADGDALADRVRLTYSERVRHAADRDGRYPFTVEGYTIRSIGRAAGKTLVVLLAEQTQPDPAAAPAIRYRRTRNQPVGDRAGNQAVAQRFARATAHGRQPTPTPTPTTPAPGPLDADGDGTPDPKDCAPANAAIHPGAADLPDLAFVDSNCDGIDGTEGDAVFVAPNGNDANPGTKARPKREIQAAVVIAAATKRYVLVAFGTYARVNISSGVSIYGGYDPTAWQRRDRYPDGLPMITDTTHGVLADSATGIVLQHVGIAALAPGGGTGSRSVYGIRAVNGSTLSLERVVVGAGNAAAGLSGTDGKPGARAGNGGNGQDGSCDGNQAAGGLGGSSPAERRGGSGGSGGLDDGFPIGVDDFRDGKPGDEGRIGTPGGLGGEHGNPGKPGQNGVNGENGAVGAAGVGGNASTAAAGQIWVGRSGESGGTGKPGNGGGGGGGGGSQQGIFVNNGGGNGGGGGGGGGAGGTGGTGGGAGHGSFGIYLQQSKIVVSASTIVAGNGGAGGRGGDGGREGAGGRGGRGGRACTSEIGAGGNGGAGGAGGRGGGGGGGAGGPSIGIFKVGTSSAKLEGSKVTVGTAGAGGAAGRSAPGGAGDAGANGIAQPVFP